MLLESSDSRYVGPSDLPHLSAMLGPSRHVWGEIGFPLIILLQGELVSYEWYAFVKEFGFAPNYHMRGNTMRLADARLSGSRFQTDNAFIAEVLTSTGIKVPDMERDFQAFANNLEVHFRLVKAREAQQKFRRDVLQHQGCSCSVCDIGFQAVLDAAHIVPKEVGSTDDYRNVWHFAHSTIECMMQKCLPSNRPL